MCNVSDVKGIASDFLYSNLNFTIEKPESGLVFYMCVLAFIQGGKRWLKSSLNLENNKSSCL